MTTQEPEGMHGLGGWYTGRPPEPAPGVGAGATGYPEEMGWEEGITQPVAPAPRPAPAPGAAPVPRAAQQRPQPEAQPSPTMGDRLQRNRKWLIGCGVATAAALALCLCCGSSYAAYNFLRRNPQIGIPGVSNLPGGAAAGQGCPPAVDLGGSITGGGNDGTFRISSQGGPTLADVTIRDGSVFDVYVVVLPPGQSATAHNVFGDHAWGFAPGCSPASVQAQVPGHVRALNQLPNTLAQPGSLSSLEGNGILTIGSRRPTQPGQLVARESGQMTADIPRMQGRL